MRILQELPLYTDTLGCEVSTPILQIGKGAPHTVLVALQHGWEIIGLDTALQVMRDIKAQGTITLIAVASPVSYSSGSRLTEVSMGPSSKQPANINRLHPGRKDGNTAERSAWSINNFIESLNPDYLIDLHSYSSQSVPHSIVDACEAKLQERIRQWMNDSKIAWYQEYEGEPLLDHGLDKSLSAVWTKRGVPSITLELGPLQLFSPQQSQQAREALTNVLITCKSAKGKINPQIAPNTQDRIWQRSEIIYDGSKGGYLRPVIGINTHVKKGTVLAEVVTPDGNIVDTINAHETGIHFLWHNEYRVISGSLLGILLVPYRNSSSSKH